MARTVSSRVALFATVALLATFAVAPGHAQNSNDNVPPPSPASAIDPLPFAMFSYLSNALLYGTGQALAANAPPTLGELFKVTQGALADNIRRAERSINAANEALKRDLAKAGVQAREPAAQARASPAAQADDGTAAINALCSIYSAYAAAPNVINVIPTPSPALNNLLRGTCASVSSSAEQSSTTRTSLASLPIADALATFNAGLGGVPAAPAVRAQQQQEGGAPRATEARAIGTGTGSMAGSNILVGTGEFLRAFAKLAEDVGQASQQLQQQQQQQPASAPSDIKRSSAGN